jgi:hypothetical protein
VRRFWNDSLIQIFAGLVVLTIAALGYEAFLTRHAMVSEEPARGMERLPEAPSAPVKETPPSSDVVPPGHIVVYAPSAPVKEPSPSSDAEPSGQTYYDPASERSIAVEIEDNARKIVKILDAKLFSESSVRTGTMRQLLRLKVESLPREKAERPAWNPDQSGWFVECRDALGTWVPVVHAENEPSVEERKGLRATVSYETVGAAPLIRGVVIKWDDGNRMTSNVSSTARGRELDRKRQEEEQLRYNQRLR